MGSIVQIDVSAQIIGLLHILHRRNIGREHNVRTNRANGLGHQQLCVAGAVAAAALFLQNLQDVGVGSSLYGKVLPEAGIPAECGFQGAGVGADAGLVIDVEGSRNLLNNFLGLVQGQKGSLLHGVLLRIKNKIPMSFATQGAKSKAPPGLHSILR